MSNKTYCLLWYLSPNMVIYSSLGLYLCFLSCLQRSRHCGTWEHFPNLSSRHPVVASWLPSTELFLSTFCTVVPLGKKAPNLSALVGVSQCVPAFPLMEGMTRHSGLLHIVWRPSAPKSKHKWRQPISCWEDCQHQATTTF